MPLGRKGRPRLAPQLGLRLALLAVEIALVVAFLSAELGRSQGIARAEWRTCTPPAGIAAGARTAPVHFLVLFSGASGSSAFISELAGHSQILVPGYEPWEKLQTWPEAHEYALNAFEEARDKQCLAVGFKVRPRHFRKYEAEVRQFLAAERVILVVQYRHSILDKAVGSYATQREAQVNQFQLRRMNTTARETGNPRFEITDWKAFDKLITSKAKSSKKLLKTAGKFGAVAMFTHEDYIFHREDTMRRFYKVLDLEYENHSPDFYQVAPHATCHRITNYQAVCKRYWCHKDVGALVLVDPAAGCHCTPVPSPC